MSRLFDDAATEYLYINSAVVGTPFAAVGWFNSNDVNHTGTLFWLGDKDVDDQYHTIMCRNAGLNNILHAQSRNVDVQQADTSTGYTVNTWHHFRGLFVSATDRRILIDGGSKGTDANNITLANIDRTALGVHARASLAVYFSGMLAECAVYDLSAWPGATDSDKANNFEKILPSLTKGFTPEHYPLGRVAYWDLVRGLNDGVGGYNLTASGTVVAAHPKVIMPCGVL